MANHIKEYIQVVVKTAAILQCVLIGNSVVIFSYCSNIVSSGAFYGNYFISGNKDSEGF